jgi:hypothetical protein
MCQAIQTLIGRNASQKINPIIILLSSLICLLNASAVCEYISLMMINFSSRLEQIAQLLTNHFLLGPLRLDALTYGK